MFYGCNSLTSVTIPDSVASIGNSAFLGCKSLTSIDVTANNANYASIDGVLFNKDKTMLIQCPGGKSGSYIIPGGVTSIGDDAFYYCESLTNVTIADSVTSIGKYAFYYCKSLTSVNIPDGITSIGEKAFCVCESLTSVTIADSVTSIGEYAFYYCKSLTSVNIPDGVTNIGESAFYGCDSLTDVYYTGSGEEWRCIVIGTNNKPLINANIHYNYIPLIPEIGEVTSNDKGDVIEIKTKINNLPQNATVMAISYGEDGETLETAEIKDESCELDKEGVKKVKVFVWESLQSMKPLCEAKETTIEK